MFLITTIIVVFKIKNIVLENKFIYAWITEEGEHVFSIQKTWMFCATWNASFWISDIQEIGEENYSASFQPTAQECLECNELTRCINKCIEIAIHQWRPDPLSKKNDLILAEYEQITWNNTSH